MESALTKEDILARMDSLDAQISQTKSLLKALRSGLEEQEAIQEEQPGVVKTVEEVVKEVKAPTSERVSLS